MKKNLEILEKTPVFQAIFRLAIPSVLAMLVQVIYGLTDTFFIGQTGDANLVASISLIHPFAMVLQAIGNIFAFGGGAYVSQKLGAKKYDDARQICASSFYLSALTGMMIALIFQPCIGFILHLLGASPLLWNAAQAYLSILISCSFIQILQIVLAGLIRSEGATKKAMYGILVGTGLNIILDYFFILVFSWGIAGAAWATMLGNLGGVLYYLFYFSHSKTFLSIHWRYFKPSAQMVESIIAIGLPVALNTLIMSISHILTNNVAMSYGETTMAASGIMGRLLAVGVFLQMGIAQGYQPFAAYSYGAKNFERLKKGFWVALKMSFVIGAVIVVTFFTSGHYLVSLFIDNEEVISKSVIMINAFAWALPLFAFNFLTGTTFQSAGRPNLALMLVLLRQLVLFIPMLYGLNFLFGFQGFIFAQPLSDLPIALLAFFLLHRFFKKTS
ncbi:MAG: MATE family efflux transporter [Alphaproteobacteria bacterium]